MWLKVHYPGEFVWALLCSAKNDEDRVSYIEEAIRLGLVVRPPNVNLAGAQWAVVDGGLVMPLLDLKGVGMAAIGAIEAKRPFTDFVDFAKRIDRRRCNRGVVNILLQVGALKELVPNQRWLAENLERVWTGLAKAGTETQMITELIESADRPDWTDDEQQAAAAPYMAHAFSRDVPRVAAI